eukprot:TRINITY_DN23112_c0_g1_i3.p1 TRINITY_DN23112_c0_g1~~TRINITY_DN23112_c0_g1_i3.p1  ORF type:complete len:692 (-),score=100.12 TRINITY_DN23112_c0_g1_i3:627-2702(-)
MGCSASAGHQKPSPDAAPLPALLVPASGGELPANQQCKGRLALKGGPVQSYVNEILRKRIHLVDQTSKLEVCGAFTEWNMVSLRPTEAIDSQIATLIGEWAASVASAGGAAADNPETMQRCDGIPFLFKKNGEWTTDANFATAPAADYPHAVQELTYSGPNVQVIYETYEWYITNGLRDVHLKLTHWSAQDGDCKIRGASDLAPGSRTKWKGKANFGGGLNLYVTYTAHISGKDVSAAFQAHADVASTAVMYKPRISDTTLIQIKRNGQNWEIQDTCAAGWHWDSDVDACVKSNVTNRSLYKVSETYSISEKQSFSQFAESTTGQVVEKIIQFGLGKIPYVGSLLSSLVGVFWPSSGIDPQDLWDSIEKYAEALFDKKIVRHDKEQFLQIMGGIANRAHEITGADQSRKGQILNTCITQCDILKELVTNDFDTYFSVGLAVLTLHLTLNIMYLDLDGKIWPVPLNQAEIDKQYDKINDTLTYEKRLRELMAKMTKDRGNTPYDERTIAIEMDVYWDMVRVWPAMFKGMDLAKLTGPTVVADRNNYFWPVGVKSPASSFTDIATTHIQEVVVRCGDWMNGIRFKHDGGVTSGFHGQKGGNPSVQYLDDDEYINGVTGNAGHFIYNLVFQTTTGNTMNFPFHAPSRGQDFWTSIPVSPRLGRDVLLAVHGGVDEGNTQVTQLYFEFGPRPKTL